MFIYVCHLDIIQDFHCLLGVQVSHYGKVSKNFLFFTISGALMYFSINFIESVKLFSINKNWTTFIKKWRKLEDPILRCPYKIKGIHLKTKMFLVASFILFFGFGMRLSHQSLNLIFIFYILLQWIISFI